MQGMEDPDSFFMAIWPYGHGKMAFVRTDTVVLEDKEWRVWAG